MTAPSPGYIEPIRLLGTTWYERGLGYWLRRAGLSLAYLLFTAICGGLTVLIGHAFWTSPAAPLPLKWILTLIVVAVVAASAATTARAFNQEYASVDRRPGKNASRRLLGASAGLVGLARLTVVGLFALAFCAFIGFGGTAMMFFYSLRPEFFGEHQARLRNERRDQDAHQPR